MTHEDIKYEQACILYNLGKGLGDLAVLMVCPGVPDVPPLCPAFALSSPSASLRAAGQQHGPRGPTSSRGSALLCLFPSSVLPAGLGAQHRSCMRG